MINYRIKHAFTRNAVACVQLVYITYCNVNLPPFFYPFNLPSIHSFFHQSIIQLSIHSHSFAEDIISLKVFFSPFFRLFLLEVPMEIKPYNDDLG